MASMFRWYQAKLASRPLLTQSITTAVLFGTGDVMAQQLVEKNGVKNHNLARTGRMVLYGGAVFGPAATTWFAFLQRNVTLSTTAGTAFSRVFLDQLIFTPINLTCFLSSMALMEGSGKEGVRQKLKSTWWPALEKNWLIWPAVQGVNFTVVPLEFRVLVVNVVALGWNCYLSFLNSGGGQGKSKEESGKSVEEQVGELTEKVKEL